MERVKTNELIEWYNKKNRKPLIIWGARQVGKTYMVVELFAKKYCRDYVYIDLKRDEEALAFFKTTSNPVKYLSYIELKYGKKITNECPLIIDEAQLCLNVLSSLKYFYQDYPELPVIVTGSLVRLSLKRNGDDETDLFPVGKTNKMKMYPMLFEDYLLNTNKNLLKRINDAYYAKKPLESYEHKMALDSLNEFLQIGGLPEVVKIYLESKSYTEAYATLKDIYDDYLDDMQLYKISDSMLLKTRNIFKNIFPQLNKENENFKISLVEKGKSNRDYFDAYEWLNLANIIYKSTNINGKVSLPLMKKSEGLFRLYLADQGMFAYQSNAKIFNYFTDNKNNTLNGIFYENYVATELMAQDIPLFYWTGKKNHEFEFIIENQNQIIPIDVKKSDGKLNSWVEFQTTNKTSFAIKISSNNIGFDANSKILTIPLYMTFLLAKDIKNNKKILD